jgi:DnaJ-domain-containing protein 1
MTKAEWNRKCEREGEAAWNAAHPPDREAARHTAAIAAQSQVVFDRFMARDAADKRARSEALVSHSMNASEEYASRLEGILERRFLMIAAWNATEGRVQMLG